MNTIKKGSRGEDVRELQRALGLIADGIFGQLTHEVLVAYQKEKGLVADGVAGPNTWDAIKKDSLHGLPENLTRKSKRNITDIVIHCTASKEGVEMTVDKIRELHKKSGWQDIGYHIVVDLVGRIWDGRNVDYVGAHVSGYNKNSIGVVYVGGLNINGKAKDTRTDAQKTSLEFVVKKLKKLYPNAKVRGHRDYSPDKNGDGIISPCEWIKACPCFDAAKEYELL